MNFIFGLKLRNGIRSDNHYNKLNDLLQQKLKDLRERTHKMREDLDKCGRSLEAIIRMDKIAYPEYWGRDLIKLLNGTTVVISCSPVFFIPLNLYPYSYLVP
jgi:hypothetical protein